MSNYQNGKIYKITSPSIDKIYIGSTVQTLTQRFSGHSHDFYNGTITSCTEMFENNDCFISLLEEYPCNCKSELVSREQYYMELNKDFIINKRKAVGNRAEDQRRQRKTEKHKNRMIRDKEKNKKQNHDRYERNKNTPEFIEKRKTYRENTKSQKSKTDAIYRLNNYNKIQAQKKAYYDWERSWGGDRRYNNNPLSISIDLFQLSLD